MLYKGLKRFKAYVCGERDNLNIGHSGGKVYCRHEVLEMDSAPLPHRSAPLSPTSPTCHQDCEEYLQHGRHSQMDHKVLKVEQGNTASLDFLD